MIQTVTQRHTRRRWPLFLAVGLSAGFLLLCLLLAVIVALAVLYGHGGLPGGVGLPGIAAPTEAKAKQFILDSENDPGSVEWNRTGPNDETGELRSAASHVQILMPDAMLFKQTAKAIRVRYRANNARGAALHLKSTKTIPCTESRRSAGPAAQEARRPVSIREVTGPRVRSLNKGGLHNG